MNNKIIGFTISRKPTDHSGVDFFHVGLSFYSFCHEGFFIYLWGSGDLKKCFLDEKKISLSFPLSDSLLDRNIIIILENNGVRIKNDWLGSIPVFYNKEMISTLFSKIATNEKITIDTEGLANYLEFGFSVFEQTPFKNICFLRYASEAIMDASGIKIKHDLDPAKIFLDRYKQLVQPEEVINLTKKYIGSKENQINGELIIPTSGGFDSRFLNLLIKNKSRIRSFSYGVSKKQTDSHEVIKAKRVSEVLKTKWEQILLSNYNKYYEDWFKLYGGAIHLHGMYHIDFFKKILPKITKPATLLSGIFGDVWSGNVKTTTISSPNKLSELSYSHGIAISPKIMTQTIEHSLRNKFFEENKDYLKDNKFKIITTIRLKIILISYLMSLPDYFGLCSWTPFLNMEIALKTLFLDNELRNNRKWQVDFFEKNNLNLEKENLLFSEENLLDQINIFQNPISNIDIKTLSPFIKKSVLKKIAKEYSRLIKGIFKINIQTKIKNFLLCIKCLGIFLKKLDCKYVDPMRPYTNLIILKSIELSLKNTFYDQKN